MSANLLVGLPSRPHHFEKEKKIFGKQNIPFCFLIFEGKFSLKNRYMIRRKLTNRPAAQESLFTGSRLTELCWCAIIDESIFIYRRF